MSGNSGVECSKRVSTENGMEEQSAVAPDAVVKASRKESKMDGENKGGLGQDEMRLEDWSSDKENSINNGQ